MKQTTVSFYVIEPVEGIDGQATFAPKRYPRAETFEVIGSLDPAAESYRIREDLFGGEFLCLLHENGPETILGAYYRDNLGKLLTEYKGEISEAMLREGEAPVDASYLAFFPGDVVGVLRTSPKSPGHARVAEWLSFTAGCPCRLTPLRDPDALMQLNQQPDGIRRLVIGARKVDLPEIENYAPSVAQVLRAAASLHTTSEWVSYEASAQRARRNEFSRHALQQLHDLMEAIPALKEVKVTLEGRRNPINLKRLHVTSRVHVTLLNTSRIGPREAPRVLLDAYEQEQSSIEQAADLHWRSGESGAEIG